MKCTKEMMLLYAVTDRQWCGSQTLYSQVEKALKGGVTCIQLREKELNYTEFEREGLEISKLCKKYHVPLIINDNADIAVNCMADGLHIGQNDISAKEARRIIGSNMILGVSVHSVKEAVEAVNNGADYLGVGAVFATSTKNDADSVSLEELRNICRVTDVPVVAIGGINKSNILTLSGCGADGVALVSAVFSATDIENECRILKKLSREMVAKVYDNSLIRKENCT